MGEADLFVAITFSGPVNLVACLRAQELGAKRVVARVGEAHYFEDPRGVYPGYMGLDLVVNEQFIVAAELRRLVRAQVAGTIETFCDQQVEMVEMLVDEAGPGVDRPIGEISLPPRTIIAGLRRRETVVIPNKTDKVHIGDHLVLVGDAEKIDAAEALFAHKRQRYNKRTFIIGGGRSGMALAEALEHEGTRVVLIERNPERCRVLSEKLAGVEVLRGDGTDVNLLEESGAARADVFCSVSGLDEVNLMAGLLARDLGARRCITLVHKPDYVTVCHRLGLDTNVSPRLLVARELIKQLRTGSLVHAVEVFEGQGVVLELTVGEASRVAHKSLGDAGFPRGAIVAARARGAAVGVPTAEAILEPGDHLVIFTRPDARAAVERLFKRSMFGGHK